MRSVRCLFLALLLAALGSPLVAAHPSPDDGHDRHSRPPSRSRSFTVKSFQPYNPPGSGLTGLPMVARGGNFFLTSNVPASEVAVLSVDKTGRAYLDVGNRRDQQVFIDTVDGHLGYSDAGEDKLLPGAIVVNFLHLGSGTAVYTDRGGLAVEPPAVFQWLGSQNDFWFACPRPDGRYQMFKQMTAFGPPDLSGCTVLELAALNHSG